MSPQVNPRQLTLVGVSFRCQVETHKFLQGKQHDTRYCFELFRRALEEPNSEESKEVWAYVYERYYDLTVRWVSRHQLFRLTGEPADYFANVALTKMWLYFAKETGTFSAFADLRSLLRFLQMCINSEIVDYYRKHVLRIKQDDEDGKNPIDSEPAPKPRFDPPEIEELWQEVYNLTNTELERLWVHAYFELLLPRRKILKLFPQFNTLKQVKRTQDTFMKRAKRNQRLKHLLEMYR